MHGEEYRQLAKRSTGYTVETDAVRGEIVDRNGEGLVVNTTHYKLVIDKLYADADSLNDTILSLVDLMERTGEKWNDALPIKLNPKGKFYFVQSDDAAEEKKRLLSEDYLNLDENTDAQKCITSLKRVMK